jgi:hypothetical protein
MNAVSLILGLLLILAGASMAIYGPPGVSEAEANNPAFRTGTLIGSVLVGLVGLWLTMKGLGGRRATARAAR